MAGLFQHVDELLKKKVIDEPPEEFEKGFNTFMINRVLSCDQSLVLVANEANRPGFTKKMTRDLYFHGLPKINRFIKYSAKKQKADTEMKYIMDYFGVNMTTAKDMFQLIDQEELDRIVEYYEKRGKTKK